MAYSPRDYLHPLNTMLTPITVFSQVLLWSPLMIAQWEDLHSLTLTTLFLVLAALSPLMTALTVTSTVSMTEILVELLGHAPAPVQHGTMVLIAQPVQQATAESTAALLIPAKPLLPQLMMAQLGISTA